MKTKRTFAMDCREKCSSGTKKKRRLSFSEDESNASCSKADSPPLSKIYNSTCRSNKPAELFRKDLISAMKLPDSEQLNEGDFWYVTDTWKQEWERGVQVPVNSKNVPFPKIRKSKTKSKQDFKLPKKFITLFQSDVFSADTHVISNASQEAEKCCRYDLDDLDFSWLKVLNEHHYNWGMPPISEEVFELVIESFEIQCFNKFQEALKTEEGLGIEYDDDVMCDVCRNPECEEGNEMVFCDICNICVHQACYGITAIPEGSWVCRTCAANVQPQCVLCPNKGGAMKSTKEGDVWAHVSCALWVPEVIIIDPEKMEPISSISQIPPSRWALICVFCRERFGACIQCCVKQCKVAYHVTCAFENGLDVNAVFSDSTEDDGVKLKSYCLKHSQQNQENSTDTENPVRKMKNAKKENKANKVSDLEKHNARLQKIREMEAEFYNYVDCKSVKVPQVDQELLDMIYCYWKLKRTANYNKPLLSTKLDESALLGKHPEDSLYARMKMFVHLRQDLERVRNLCYMVSRREKLRRTYIKTQEEIFLRQLDALTECAGKQHLKEQEAIRKMSFGNTIYDKIYFEVERPPPETPASKPKEGEGEKKKLASTARLPNPYAKLYFNGMHTRSRGHNNTSASVDSTSIKSEQSSENVNAQSLPSSPSAVKTVEKGRRSSVPSSPVVIRLEPITRERRSSAHYLETSKSQECSKEPIVEEKIASDPDEEVFQKTHLDTELRGEDIGKENVPTLCTEVKKAEALIDSVSLCDVKNSPSQSDKENMAAKPKVRGRRSKSQSDSKTIVEVSKIGKDNNVLASEKQCAHDSVKTVPVSDVPLKVSNCRSSRYEMRSRNSSSSLSLDELPPELPSKAMVLNSEVETASDPLDCKADSLNSKSLDSEPLDPEHQETERLDPKPLASELVLVSNESTNVANSKETIPQKKVRLKSFKRRTRRRLFKKLYKERSESSRTLNSDSSGSEDFAEEEELSTHHLPRIEQEYKMTLRQNGKVVLSPLRKSTASPDSRPCATSPSKSPHSPSKSLRNAMNHTDGPDRVSPHDEPNSESCDSQHTSSSSRDATASPRIVLKLVKDRTRQQWQKRSVSPGAPSTFKVIRNDWEMTSDSKDSLLSSELESLAAFIDEPNGHRYMMRRRSKQHS